MRHHVLIVECLDDDSLNAAKRWDFPNVHAERTIFDMPPSLSDFANYSTVAFNEFVKYKFLLVFHHLTEDLWYLDADIAIFHDPVLFLRDFDSHDWLMQLDADQPHRLHHWCTGCFLAKNTPASRRFLEQFLHYYKTKSFNDKDDQKIFNRFVTSTDFKLFCEGEKFSCAPLDPKLFQNGKNAFRRGWYKTEKPVFVHANYRRGEHSKISALMACGKWFNRANGH
jgi:hypothetical protein